MYIQFATNLQGCAEGFATNSRQCADRFTTNSQLIRNHSSHIHQYAAHMTRYAKLHTWAHKLLGSIPTIICTPSACSSLESRCASLSCRLKLIGQSAKLIMARGPVAALGKVFQVGVGHRGPRWEAPPQPRARALSLQVQGRRAARAKRHVLGASNALHKLIDEREAGPLQCVRRLRWGLRTDGLATDTLPTDRGGEGGRTGRGDVGALRFGYSTGP